MRCLVWDPSLANYRLQSHIENLKLFPKLSDFNAGISGTIGSLRAGINPAPTKRVDLPVVGAGFTPARIGCWASRSFILGVSNFGYSDFGLI